MAEESNDLLREAVELLKGIKTSLDEAERSRAEALQSFQAQTDELMGGVDYGDFDDEDGPFGGEPAFEAKVPSASARTVSTTSKPSSRMPGRGSPI